MNYLNLNSETQFALDCLLTSNYDERYQKIFAGSIPFLLKHVSTYPADPNYTSLKETISKKFKVKDLVLGAGSEDLIIKINYFLLAQKSQVGIVRPIFYRIQETYEGRPKYLSEKDFLLGRFDNLQIVWLTNPNLLSGNILDVKKLHNIITSNSKIIFIIDEAGMFLVEDWKKYSLLGKNIDNVFLIESFSKAYGLSGMRASFATGNKFILNGISKYLLTFPITSVTERLIDTALTNQNVIDKILSYIQKNKAEIEKIFRLYCGFELIKNKTNCVFVRNKSKNIYQSLISEGINCLDLDRENRTLKRGFTRITIHSSEISFNILKKTLLNILEREYEKKN